MHCMAVFAINTVFATNRDNYTPIYHGNGPQIVCCVSDVVVVVSRWKSVLW